LAVKAINTDQVLAWYEYQLKDSTRHRNCEILTVRGGRIVEVQVFFGGRY
jgi:hypothetical protein